MVFDRKRTDEMPRHARRSREHGRDARATEGKKCRENMRFCETNRIHDDGFFDVTAYVYSIYRETVKKLNPVRLAKPNPFCRWLVGSLQETNSLEDMASCGLPCAWESEEMA